MREEDLDKTKPIATLKDLASNDLEEEQEQISRTQKNLNLVEKQIESEQEEEAEEALAEKNIALAENYLSEEKEKETKEDELVFEQDKEKNVFKKLKEQWNKLDKSKKIMVLIVGVLFIAFLVLLIVFIISSAKKEEPAIEEEVPPVVDEAPVLGDHYYYKNGSLYFLDLNEQEIGSYECTNKDANLCYIGFNKVNDTFDVPILLDQDENLKEQRYPILSDNYVFIVDSKNEKTTSVKLYSIKDKKILEEYTDAKVYDDNYAIVSNDQNKYGLIKVEDGITEYIVPQYDYLGMISGEDNLIAKYNRGYKVIDRNNKKLSSDYSSSYEMKTYNNNYIVAKVAGDYNVYDYDGNLIATDYDFITVQSKFIALVKKDKVYVIDGDKTKYNEDGVELKNNDYVKKYVYDENDSLKTTKKSFEITVNTSGDIDISVYDGDALNPNVSTLRVVEALANAKYEYVNYFGKKLYFYKDKEKEKLIGSYTCSNGNEIRSQEDEFNNCFIAIDSIYEDNDMVTLDEVNRKSRVPIINERYVFIADGSSNVILYDLVKQASISSAGYASISSYTANNDYKVSTYNGKINVVALNKKGKYGMLSIDGDNLTTKYQFSYNKMEKLGNYMIALNSSSNTWEVLDGDDTIASGFEGKLRGYNSNVKYFKAMSNNEYHVYNINAEVVSEESYAYVELYEDYYAAVNKDNEVNIYDYNGNKLSNKGIKIGNYAYYKTENPAFKVRKENDRYIVDVYNGTEYEEVVVNDSEETEEE